MVFGDEFLALKITAEVSTDQLSSFMLTQSITSFFTLSYTQRHCHVRIEKGPVQTVAIKLDAHNSLQNIIICLNIKAAVRKFCLFVAISV